MDKKEALAEGLRKISTELTSIADILTKHDEPAEDISFDYVRGTLAGKAAKGYKAEVKAIIKKYGATCLSDLKDHPELFPEIIKDAGEIGHE